MRVICIDDYASSDYLVNGKEYDVVDVPNDISTYRIPSVSGNQVWNKSRFKEVEKDFFVKCVDNKGVEHILQKGAVYIARHYAFGIYCLKDLPEPNTFNKNRFVIGNDISIYKEQSFTQEEWRISRDVNRQSNECACGILKSNCSYHQ